MKINSENQKAIYLKRKVNLFVSTINELSKRLNGDIYNMQSMLRQCVQDVPNLLEEGLKSGKTISKLRNFVIAKESLEQCKKYLGMLKSMRKVSTQDLIRQVEEINRLIENQIKHKE
ncbi:MAG: four helix bundle protein [Ignavibacteria bacterium]|nr:four helix bundle protein [Ignavibacteria bacterium]